MKKSIGTALALILGLCLLTACGSKPASAPNSTSSDSQTSRAPDENTPDEPKTFSGTLRVQLIGSFSMDDFTDGTTGEKRNGLHVIKDDFETKYPGTTLEFIIMGWDDYVKKTQTMIMANEADVYNVPGIALMADMEVLEPLQPYLDADKEFNPDVYIEGQIDGWKVQPKGEKELAVYSLPMYSDTRVTGYDKTIFDQFGVEYLSEKPTIEEIMEKAAKMTGKNPVTGEENYGVCWRGLDSGDLLVNIAEGLGGSWGENFRFDELKYNFNSPEMIKAANYMKELLNYAPKGVMTNAGGENFGREGNDVAIYLRAPLFVRDAKTLGVADHYGISYPFLNPENGKGSMFAGANFAIGNTSTQKDLAWEFLKYVSTDTWQKYMWDNYALMPATKNALNFEDIKGDAQYEMCFKAVAAEWSPRYPYRAAAPKGMLSAAIEAVCNGTESAETALNKAQSDAEKWTSEQ